jgi:hypothetical protein
MFIKSLVVSVALILVSTLAQAERKRLVVVLECDSDSNRILSMVQGDPYWEQPFSVGRGVLQVAPSGTAPMDTVITVNPQTLTYTIIALFEDGHACLIVPGSDFAPYAPQEQ